MPLPTLWCMIWPLSTAAAMSRRGPSRRRCRHFGVTKMRALLIRPDQRRWLNIFGNHTRVNLTSAEIGGKYVVLEQRDPPGVGVPLHFHESQDETFYVIRGQVRFQVGDETFVAEGGATVY